MEANTHGRKVERYRRPPLKWAGGKYSVLGHVLKALPPAGRFVEPFLGSAVVFLNAEYPAYLLSDVNPDLVAFYRCLKRDGASFVEACRSLFEPSFNEPEAFYRLRDRFNASVDADERARLLLYLNRHAYNGLYRVNKSGRFNVPFGRYKRPLFPSDAMMAFHRKAQSADIVRCDFEDTMSRCTKGDMVYCDPAYVPLSPTASFTAYASGGFGMADQRRLARVARRLARHGVTVAISNHDNSITRDLYAGADIVSFEVRRTISQKIDKRGLAPELIAIFRP